jgi:hypothetical protein
MYKFYYKQTAPNFRSFSKLLKNVVNDLPEGGRFYFNLARATGMESYIFRDGEWSDPFETAIEPQFAMPAYNSNFNLNFAEVSDMRALDIKKLINSTNRPVMIQWSGGIDSTVAIVSLLKNLTPAELSKISVSMSGDTALENPHFFNKFIKNKFKIVDSEKLLYNDYEEKFNAFCICADTGDCLFGAELGNKLYPRMKFIQPNISKFYSNVSSQDLHYSVYKDIIIQHLNNNLKNSLLTLAKQQVLDSNLSLFLPGDENFGEMFYEKIVKNVNTSQVPINSLHDFFWWTIFNGRYLHCALRAPVTYSVGNNKRSLINDCVIQWYNTDEYQLWSMTNNNNGEKLIGPTQGLYKTAAKKYIFDFDKDEWYQIHKIKIISLPNIIKRNWKDNYTEFDPILGIDTNYDIVKIGTPDVDNYVIDRLVQFKIDWC